ncbi:hypothetical protein [Cryobacterium gelidum]|uniref:hypothetical protein n=1 Tax=Cryobacterium gelidum TaxID=1259164 RepID=UPI00141A7A8B|nr:hypothetical protein [Cryobacterium gelidum]
MHRDNEVSAPASGIRGAFLCGAIIARFAIPAAFLVRRPPLGEPVAIRRYSSALV